MKELFKKYKKAFYILGAILFVLIIWLLERYQEKNFRYPLETREPTQTKAPDYRGIPLELEYALPKSGTVVETFADTIVMKFNAEVSEETIDFTVTPEISLSARTFRDKTELHIFPDKIEWERDVTYTLKINRLEGIENYSLQEPIIYEFTRSPDETILLGDPPPQPGEEF